VVGPGKRRSRRNEVLLQLDGFATIRPMKIVRDATASQNRLLEGNNFRMARHPPGIGWKRPWSNFPDPDFKELGEIPVCGLQR
jgi:hypothetical protein